MKNPKVIKQGKVIEYDFTKKRVARDRGVRVLIFFWRRLSRDGQLSVLDYAVGKVGDENIAKRERRSMVKSRRG